MKDKAISIEQKELSMLNSNNFSARLESANDLLDKIDVANLTYETGKAFLEMSHHLTKAILALSKIEYIQ